MRRKWSIQQVPDLSGRVAVVTGASSGIGWWAARGLASRGARVVLACRDTTRGERAAAAIRAAVPRARLECMDLDLADLASVRAFGMHFSARHERLDILCNNAGVMALPLCRTRQGFEMQMGTNHLGHFALTGQLMPQLCASPGARVVNVASQAHVWTEGLDLDDLNWERRPYDKWDAYAKSKLANLLFSFELERRLRAAGLPPSSLAAHPGMAATNLGQAGPAMENSRWGRWTMQTGMALLGQPAAMGALPILYAAAAPEAQGCDYIGPDGWRQMRGFPCKVRCRSTARDGEASAMLWNLSQRLTGVQYL